MMDDEYSARRDEGWEREFGRRWMGVIPRDWCGRDWENDKQQTDIILLVVRTMRWNETHSFWWTNTETIIIVTTSIFLAEVRMRSTKGNWSKGSLSTCVILTNLEMKLFLFLLVKHYSFLRSLQFEASIAPPSPQNPIPHKSGLPPTDGWQP